MERGGEVRRGNAGRHRAAPASRRRGGEGRHAPAARRAVGAPGKGPPGAGHPFRAVPPSNPLNPLNPLSGRSGNRPRKHPGAERVGTTDKHRGNATRRPATAPPEPAQAPAKE
ncbi:hypothetical protein GCM10027160_11960 [Streptomyces calidiresistens]